MTTKSVHLFLWPAQNKTFEEFQRESNRVCDNAAFRCLVGLT